MNWKYITLNMPWGKRNYRYQIINDYPHVLEYLNESGCWELSKNINVKLRIKREMEN